MRRVVQRRRRLSGDCGSATVELAVGLPALIVLLLAGLTAISAVTAQLRCIDAAREAARAQARGEAGVTAGQRTAPGTTITLDEGGELVRSRATVVLRPLGRHLPSITVAAGAVAAREHEGLS